MKAPVIIFIYNRAGHTKKTLAALNENRLAAETDLFIYADNAKDLKGQSAVDEARKAADEFAALNHFHSTTVIKAERNKGLADSIIGGVSEVIAKYRRAIVIEDDLITSRDFLEYMNGALDFYENQPDIWSISGYTPYLARLAKYPHDVYSCYRASSWGWATWLDRWNTVDWNVADYESFLHDAAAQQYFNLGGSDMTNMLIDWHEGRNHSWAIRWCYSQAKARAMTVYPKESRITNAGNDNSGTHTGSTSRYDTPFWEDHDACRFEKLPADEKLLDEFRLIYDFSRIGKIKRLFHFSWRKKI